MESATTTRLDSPATPSAGFSLRGRLGLWLGVVLGIGLLQFLYRYLAVLAAGQSESFLKPLINEMTGVFGAGLLYLGVAAMVQRIPLDDGRAWARVPVYLASLLLYSLVHTSLNWGTRAVLYPMAGLGPYDYGRMPLRYAMEFPLDVLAFVLMVVLLHAWRHVERTRSRELQASQLEHNLSQAHLRNLQLQLRPHFLFNALNTISSVMYRDVERADGMIERLADLLRASLRTAHADQVPLLDELRVLDDYLAIMRERFEERLVVAIDVDAEASRALVPPLLLQPLLENSIRHGGIEERGSVAIEVRGRRDGAALVLIVEDDGPGLAPGTDPLREGVGLRSTADRLRLLYGNDHRFASGTKPGGGFRVEARIPFEANEANEANEGNEGNEGHEGSEGSEGKEGNEGREGDGGNEGNEANEANEDSNRNEGGERATR